MAERWAIVVLGLVPLAWVMVNIYSGLPKWTAVFPLLACLGIFYVTYVIHQKQKRAKRPAGREPGDGARTE